MSYFTVKSRVGMLINYDFDEISSMQRSSLVLIVSVLHPLTLQNQPRNREDQILQRFAHGLPPIILINRPSLQTYARSPKVSFERSLFIHQ